MPFSIDFQFVSSAIKKSLKNLAETLAGKEKASTFAPAFERERVLKNGLGEIRLEVGGEEANSTPFEKR
ncbi:MAG: hypothetical protein J6W13_10735 [Salinivirgaceae bacterium]|nr:hypothetical protein [Salinivirgaceae bacterium]